MRTPLLATLLVTLSEFEGLFGINFLSHFVSFVSMTAAQPALMSDDFTLSLGPISPLLSFITLSLFHFKLKT